MEYYPAGYQAIIEEYSLDVIPNWHRSYIYKEKQTHNKIEDQNGIKEIFPASYQPRQSIGDQLEFALKYDGINLAIFTQIFSVIDKNDLVTYIESKPTGKYARKIWFLYEFLTDTMLPLDDLEQGNYIDLLEKERYFTLERGKITKRQRIRNNLLGTKSFCPIVRKTSLLQKMEKEDFTKQSQKILSDYPDDILSRALTYLYTKETKSSFFIENEEPGTTRTQRFISLLKEAQKEDFCYKERLLDLQNRIVDERFADNNYRKNQNYVGETVSFGREKIHYISPKPKDIEELMDGLITCHKQMLTGNVHPIIHAAVISYGFVYLHPFEDGNGRIHRFLIHNILSIRDFTPEDIIFPISAVMLKERLSYDKSLEAFSSKLLPLVEYSLKEDGQMVVKSDTANLYRYIDMTLQSQALYLFIKATIEKELPSELLFLSEYEKVKKALKEIVDMPDRLIDLFIRFTMQNHGKLSKNKREKYFEKLSEKEIEKMEQTIIEIFLHEAR